MKNPTNRNDVLMALIFCVPVTVWMFAGANNWADLSEVSTTAQGGATSVVLYGLYRKFFHSNG